MLRVSSMTLWILRMLQYDHASGSGLPLTLLQTANAKIDDGIAVITPDSAAAMSLVFVEGALSSSSAARGFDPISADYSQLWRSDLAHLDSEEHCIYERSIQYHQDYERQYCAVSSQLVQREGHKRHHLPASDTFMQQDRFCSFASSS